MLRRGCPLWHACMSSCENLLLPRDLPHLTRGTHPASIIPFVIVLGFGSSLNTQHEHNLTNANTSPENVDRLWPALSETKNINSKYLSLLDSLWSTSPASALCLSRFKGSLCVQYSLWNFTSWTQASKAGAGTLRSGGGSNNINAKTVLSTRPLKQCLPSLHWVLFRRKFRRFKQPMYWLLVIWSTFSLFKSSFVNPPPPEC